jgi:hypothetical protein
VLPEESNSTSVTAVDRPEEWREKNIGHNLKVGTPGLFHPIVFVLFFG